jgi:stearoyl-CoA desaturase (delta-9 desaturase)
VRKTAPQLKLGAIQPVADSKTLEALIAHRYEVMAGYAAGLKAACGREVERLKAAGATSGAKLADMRLARRWLHRDEDKIPAGVKAQVAKVAEHHAELGKLVAMREELRSMWTRTNVSAEQLVADLQAWCHKAEQSGIVALQEFSMRLRAARA